MGALVSDVAIDLVPDAKQDAISALVSLGFKEQEASKAVAAIKDPDLSSEQLIRLALKGMA